MSEPTRSPPPISPVDPAATTDTPAGPATPAEPSRLAVIGLGYVGLPVALTFARRYDPVIGFDIGAGRVAELRAGIDRNDDVEATALQGTTLQITDDPEHLAGADTFVVTVPTPIDRQRRPDLTPLRRACETVGRHLRPGALVVFESTVFPGATEEVCAPILERVSGLRFNTDFVLGYSPERINPGDRQHTLERITKVVSGSTPAALDRVAALYGPIIEAGLHRTPSIRTAEAAKVIENIQRDLNIALMNELSLIFDRLGLRTADVLAAAGTKWNFLKFTPGLVGGHCIGVDPYYLTAKAEEVGYHPEVILAGRRTNDLVGRYVAQKMIRLLAQRRSNPTGARVAVLGLTFKENVRDIRNSRIPDMVAEMTAFGVAPMVHDPLADPAEARQEYGLTLCDDAALRDLDGVVLAVPHRAYLEPGVAALVAGLRPDAVVIDVKSALDPDALPPGLLYWSL